MAFTKGHKINQGRRTRRVSIVCAYCEKQFENYVSNKGAFCSKICYHASTVGKPSHLKGAVLSTCHKQKLRDAWKKRAPMTKETKRKYSLANLGEKHWNWQGGITDIKRRMRRTWQWKTWRTFVFERDNYTCQECGQRGVYIEPHHIIPLYKTLRYAYMTTNGITLCRPCHRKTMHHEAEFVQQYHSITSFNL